MADTINWKDVGDALVTYLKEDDAVQEALIEIIGQLDKSPDHADFPEHWTGLFAKIESAFS